MRYRFISKEGVDRLTEQGYTLSDGEKSFIDEITMIVLSEDPEGDRKDEEIIERIITLAKRHLNPIPEEKHPKNPSVLGKAGISAPSLWDSMIPFITSRKEGPKE